jgi:hypothetical protein
MKNVTTVNQLSHTMRSTQKRNVHFEEKPSDLTTKKAALKAQLYHQELISQKKKDYVYTKALKG